MDELDFTSEEAKQTDAVIYALENGIKSCTDEERKYIKRYITNQKSKLREYKEKSDEVYFKALELFAIETR